MRLPRKKKKAVKKIVSRKMASKMIMTAMLTASSRTQLAMISATPMSSPMDIPLKALKVVQTVSDTAQAIGKIMSEPPNSWKEFIKPTI
jgi:hypothetical protein